MILTKDNTVLLGGRTETHDSQDVHHNSDSQSIVNGARTTEGCVVMGVQQDSILVALGSARQTNNNVGQIAVHLHHN